MLDNAKAFIDSYMLGKLYEDVNIRNNSYKETAKEHILKAEKHSKNKKYCEASEELFKAYIFLSYCCLENDPILKNCEISYQEGLKNMNFFESLVMFSSLKLTNNKDNHKNENSLNESEKPRNFPHF